MQLGAFPTGVDLKSLTHEGSDYTNCAIGQTEGAVASQYGLAGGVVLAAMKDLFDRHVAYINHFASTSGGDVNKKYRYGSGDGSPLYDVKDYVAEMESCINTAYDPTHWSDIQVHYYCVALNARGCYTYLTGVNFLSRSAALQACESFNGSMARTTFKGQDARPEKAGAAIEVTWDPTRVSGALDFARFYRGVELEEGKKAAFSASGLGRKFTYGSKDLSHVDVFRYVMTGKTFAFPDAQQNRVINEYWAHVRTVAAEAEKKAAIAPLKLQGKDTSAVESKIDAELKQNLPADVSSATPAFCGFRTSRRASETYGEHCKDGVRRAPAKNFRLAPQGR